MICFITSSLELARPDEAMKASEIVDEAVCRDELQRERNKVIKREARASSVGG
jgi:hypothetical protein